jgi:hypothetical protein
MMIKNASVRMWRVCCGALDRLGELSVAQGVGAGGVDEVDAVVG